ncbi:ELMO domain-containing protein 3-like isoform X2 [Antedon mediterranea]|uniref:ELMO domain-containing protein 3-like isoform X2 n=1 Tax=Antedon mediterranea TaxID=105859 RepID=UPI003AF552C1
MAEDPSSRRVRSMDSEREFQFELAFNSDDHAEDLDDFDDIFDAKYSTASPSPKPISNQYRISTAKYQKDDIWELAPSQSKKATIENQFTFQKSQQSSSTYGIQTRPLYSRSQSENSDCGHRKRNSQSEAAIIRDVPPFEAHNNHDIGSNGLKNSHRPDNDAYQPPYHTPKSSKKNPNHQLPSQRTPSQNIPPNSGTYSQHSRSLPYSRVPKTSGHAEPLHITDLNQSPGERSYLRQKSPPYQSKLYSGHDEWDFVRRTAGERRPENSDLKESLLQAQADWDAVDTIQPGKLSSVNKTPLISFNEALAYFQQCNMEIYKYKIKTTVDRSGFDAVSHFLFGPPKMNRNLLEERDLVFAIAQYQFDDNVEVHRRVLQTIYKKLTGTTIDCPRFGSHWEQIGFQGNDPTTDLRACGFLALMTLLYFVMDNNTFQLAKDIYKISQHETQNFPFCVMSVNMTRIALQTLRHERLSRECNKRQQVIAVVNEFYGSIFLNLYTTWKHGHKTIKDSGFVLKELETCASKNPKILMKKFEEYISGHKKGAKGQTSRNGSLTRDVSAERTFKGIDELDCNNVHYV